MDPALSPWRGTTWHDVLASPPPGRHIAQLYTDPAFLARAVSRFVAGGLRLGDGVVLIATPFNQRAIARRLENQGFTFDQLERRGQVTRLDAADCMAGLLVDGIPDRARFHASVVRLLAEVRGRGYGHIRAFGEIVDLLRGSNVEAAFRLEALWDEVLTTYGVSLLCGYSVDNFDRHAHHGLVQRVSRAHSDVIPVEDYGRLERAVARAYVDVFGSANDPDALRRTLVACYKRPAAMPDAQAAILAVQALVPTAADLLLERAGHYYYSTSDSGA